MRAVLSCDPQERQLLVWASFRGMLLSCPAAGTIPVEWGAPTAFPSILELWLGKNGDLCGPIPGKLKTITVSASDSGGSPLEVHWPPGQGETAPAWCLCMQLTCRGDCASSALLARLPALAPSSADLCPLLPALAAAVLL